MTPQKKRSSEGAYGLERPYVTCPEIYELETSNIFSRNWICIEHVSKIPANKIRPIAVEGNQLFLVNDGERNRVFRNFCRHRGSLLVNESNCESIGQRIQCPYHAWTYSRDGSLVAAPNMDDVESFDPKQFGLIEIPTESFGGFLWLNFDPHHSVEHYLSPIADQFSDYQLASLTVAAEIEYDVKANWKLIFQNYSECYHCPTVHPILNRLTPYKNSSNEVESGPILGGPMQLSTESETMSMDGKLVGEVLSGLTDIQKRSVNYFTIFPTIFLSTHPDYVLIHRLERLAVDRTRIVCQFMFNAEVAAAHTFDAARAVEFWDMTNRQDWDVCELAQSGMEDLAYQAGPYSNLESVLAAFDRHYFSQMQN